MNRAALPLARHAAALLLAACAWHADSARADPLPRAAVPEPLQPWVSWVLRGEEQRQCPFLASNTGDRRCAWSGALRLVVDAQGASFAQDWQAYADSWIGLPGDTRFWPQDVTRNGDAAAVVLRDGRPMLRLAPGTHRVSGRVAWQQPPETLTLPAEAALLELLRGGVAVAHPLRDAAGSLWLGGGAAAPREQDSLAVQVFRRATDEIPFELITRIEIEVSGRAREATLGPVLPPDFIAVSLASPLPARLEPDGRLRIQLRPGVHTLEIAARQRAPVATLALPAVPPPWPSEEIWVFDARPHLRLVEVTGGTPVDPRQTRLPPEWRELPAWRMSAGDTLAFGEQRRGDPEPEPNRLSLTRQLWLDFDGRGYSLQDHVTGSVTRGWRLTMNPPVDLGRVAVGGEPEFITHLSPRGANSDSAGTPMPDDARLGVEVRSGTIDLIADARIEDARGTLPAIGWDEDFQEVRASLQLPPGWRLLHASGIDTVADTWVNRWTLLDLFLTLIAAIAVWRLFGPAWGALALVALALTWHETAAPQGLWLNLVAALALARAVPTALAQGRLTAWLTRYFYVSVLVLVVSLVPFTVHHARLALYPQLETPSQFAAYDQTMAVQESMAPAAPPPMPAEAPMPEMELAIDQAAGMARQDRSQMEEGLRAKREYRAGKPKLAQQLSSQLDPKRIAQTGPGIPEWTFREVGFGWNGPVARTQQVSLWLLPPRAMFVVKLLQIALLAALALRFAGVRWQRQRPRWRWAPPATALALALLALAPPDASAQAFPPESMLQELKARLIADPDCLPFCADSPRLRIEADGDRLLLRFEVDALVPVGVPLPLPALGAGQRWQASSVAVDGVTTSVLRTADGALWVNVPAGRRQVVIGGSLQGIDRLQLPLALRPHRVETSAGGWTVEGIDEQGQPADTLQLTRIAGTATAAAAPLESDALPVFVRIERTLRLGLDWHVETRVARVAPADTPVVLQVPLLAGEAVTSEGVRVADGKVQVSLAAGQQEFAWSSMLAIRPEIVLTAAASADWVETWRIDAGTLWHVALDGIPAVHHQDAGVYLPTFRPWPGETLRLQVTRPEGAGGQTLTVLRTQLRQTPGKRVSDLTLTLRLRSSRGGQHVIVLPADAELLSASIDGRSVPLRLEAGKLALPLRPGEQEIALAWREPRGVTWRTATSSVDVGSATVNASIALAMPQDRWILWVAGPPLGAAILFWGELFAVILVAAGLARVPFTPLQFRHWLLLGIGLTQVPVWTGALIVGWLLALGARPHLPASVPRWQFNLAQVALALYTLLALQLLFGAVAHGLLGLPSMQIAGNGSSASELLWYQDRTGTVLPDATARSLPLLAYRALMLAWALWLAFALLRWLRWGWQNFTANGLWRRKVVVVDQPG